MQKATFVRDQTQALSNVKVKIAQLQDQLTQQIAASNKLFSNFDALQRKGGEMTTDIVFPLLQSFDTLEHTIYQGLTQQQFAQEEQLSLFKLLNQVQINHKAVVTTQVERDLPPWITDVSQAEDQGEVVNMWRSLTQRGGDGVFRIANETAGILGAPVPALARKDVQDDLFAALARLFTRPVGRKLLRLLHTRGLTGKAITFVLNPMSYQFGSTSPMAAPEGAGANCQWNGNTLTHNVGSGGQITCVVGLTDADMLDFDHANRWLPSPLFLGLGHELIHIAHYQHGTYTDRVTPHFAEVAAIYRKLFPKTDQPNVPAAYQVGGNLEEFLTIPDYGEQMKINAELQLAVNLQNIQYEQHIFTPKNLQEIIRMNVEADIPTETDIRREHFLGERHAHRSIANPVLYPQATEDNPGAWITRPQLWAQSVGIIPKS